MYQDILKYQDCDLQILKIRKKMEGTEYKKVISAMVSKNKDIQVDKDKLEIQAKKSIELIESAQNEIKELNKQLSSLDVKFSKEEIQAEEYSRKQIEISNQLSFAFKKITKMQKDLDQIQSQYEDLKKNATIVKTNYKNAKDAQDKVETIEKRNIEDIEKKMKSIEKNIDPILFSEYNKYKADNIMPVYVKLLIGDCCGGCMQKLSTAQQSNSDKKMICEMCRRIIIKD